MSRSVSDRLAAVLPLLEEHLDVVEGRVTSSEEPPAWCERRGLSSFLLDLGDTDLALCERDGLASWALRGDGVPQNLRDMAEAVRASTDLGPPRAMAPTSPVLAGASNRKRAQLGAWHQVLCGPESTLDDRGHSRIVDWGSGRGHLTRWAAEVLGLPALGVEREASRVERAREMSPMARVQFDRRDALTQPPPLDPSDLAIGLHACGDLGDALLDAAREVRCDVVLLPCCLQKTASDVWRPRSAQARSCKVHIRRASLGLANTTPHERGVEVSIEQTMAARGARYALRMLLESRGVPTQPGEEMRGINRRRARRGLPALAEMAFARLGLSPPTASELAWAQDEGKRRHDRVRRLSLPRSMMGRVVEVTHALDRACTLAEAGFAVDVFPLVDAKITPRNLTISGLAPRRPPRPPGHRSLPVPP